MDISILIVFLKLISSSTGESKVGTGFLIRPISELHEAFQIFENKHTKKMEFCV